MSPVVGSATFELLGDSSEYRAALDAASAKLEEWGADVQQRANAAVRGLGAIEVAGLDIVHSLEAVGAGGAEAAAGLAKIEEAGRSVAPTVEAIQELEAAGAEAGVALDETAGAAKAAGQGLREAGVSADDAGRKIKSLTERLDEVGSKLESAGRRLSVAFTLPLLALGAVATKAASDFESSFAGIRKTMDLAEGDFQRLAQANRDLAKTIPVSVNELNRIGELGGQLGIRGVENVTKFERTIAQLAVTTDLTADAAALGFAQIANILQLPQSQVDRLGAAVVDLGNNFATVESKIVDFTQRIAGAGALADLSAGSVAGIGTALASLGVEAEAGGTAVQRVLLDMVAAVAQGGDGLNAFAETAGVSAEEFARVFREDAAQAFTLFVEGLGKQGDQAISTLENLGLTDQRVARSFLSLAGAGDLLRNAITRGNQAFQENSALLTEAEKRYKTFESRVTLAWNRVKDLAITLGNALLPVFRDMLDAAEPLFSALEGLANAFAGMSDGMRTAAVGIGLVVAGLGPLLVVAGAVAQGFAALNAAAIALNITLSTGALGLIAAGAGLVAGFVLLAQSGRRAREEMDRLSGGGAPDQIQATADALEDAERRLTALARAAQRHPGNEGIQERGRAALAEVVELRKQLAALQQDVQTLPPVTVTITAGTGDGAGQVAERVREIQQELASGLSSASRLGTLLGDAFDPAAESADVLRAAIQDLVGANVEFDAKVGPQGQTLRELANLYLDTQAGVEAAAESTRELARATAEADAITRSVLTPLEEWQAAAANLDEHLFAGRVSLETYLRALDQADEAFRKAVGNTAEQVAQIEALAAAHRGGEDALKAFNREQFIAAEVAKLAADATAEQIERTRVAAGVVFDSLKTEAQKSSDTIAQAFERAGQRMFDALVQSLSNAKFSFRDFVGDALKEIARLEARLAALKLFDFLKPGGGRGKGEGFDFGGFLKSLGLAVGTAFVGGKISGRASGGSVLARHPYIIGEKGPELFVPRSAGTVVSNASMAGGRDVGGALLRALDFGRMPPAQNPLAAARDSDWQEFWQETANIAMRERGFRP